MLVEGITPIRRVKKAKVDAFNKKSGSQELVEVEDR
jgi:hypothetical protein